MAKIKQDILGNTPKVGDTIAFNPTGSKGLMSGVVQGFTKTGLPEIKPAKVDENWRGSNYPRSSEFGKVNQNGMYTPKTGFVIAKEKEIDLDNLTEGKSYIIDNLGSVGTYKGKDEDGDLLFEVTKDEIGYLPNDDGYCPFFIWGLGRIRENYELAQELSEKLKA